jgi:hypothetical protein
MPRFVGRLVLSTLLVVTASLVALALYLWLGVR